MCATNPRSKEKWTKQNLNIFFNGKIQNIWIIPAWWERGNQGSSRMLPNAFLVGSLAKCIINLIVSLDIKVLLLGAQTKEIIR